jgi:hypothetical protein
MALSQALKGLDVGIAADCLEFAKKLTKEGILTLDKLKKMAPDKVQKVLEKVKMTETQIDTIMEAVAPQPAAAAVAAPAAPAPAPKPAAFALPAAAAAAPAVAAPAPAPKAAAVAFNESPSCVATLQGHGGSDVNCVAFHASLPILATGSDDKTAKLWDCKMLSDISQRMIGLTGDSGFADTLFSQLSIDPKTHVMLSDYVKSHARKRLMQVNRHPDKRPKGGTRVKRSRTMSKKRKRTTLRHKKCKRKL